MITVDGAPGLPTVRRWMVACLLAEALGIAVAAGAARGATHLAGSNTARPLLLGFAVVIAGGLVEGTALGWFQSHALRAVLGDAGRRRWQMTTVLVAGLGWAAGSAPSTLSGADEAGEQPALALLLLGSAGLGVAMGAVLGAAQAWALVGRVRHPWRWVGASSAAWMAAMPVIFLGASSASAAWSWPQLVAFGAVTGAVAGAVLGAVSAAFLPTFDGPPLRHRTVLRLLRSPGRRWFGGGFVGLAVRGASTGRTYRFPVLAAADEEGLVVYPGHAERKAWWRNVAARPDVEVLVDGSWRAAHGRLVAPGTNDRDRAVTTYAARWPRLVIPADAPLVRVELTRDYQRGLGTNDSPTGDSRPYRQRTPGRTLIA